MAPTALPAAGASRIVTTRLGSAESAKLGGRRCGPAISLLVLSERPRRGSPGDRASRNPRSDLACYIVGGNAEPGGKGRAQIA
jgi:hypothetical protein